MEHFGGIQIDRYNLVISINILKDLFFVQQSTNWVYPKRVIPKSIGEEHSRKKFPII